jgi:hypothetical protein
MLGKTLSRLNRFLGRCLDAIPRPSALDGGGTRSRPAQKARLRLEVLEHIYAPANLTWMNYSGDGNAMNPADYLNTTTGHAATQIVQDDSLTFDGSRSNASASGLKGFGIPVAPAGTPQSGLVAYTDFGSINLINGYSGTVTLAPDGSRQLSVTTLDVASGTIFQQAAPVNGNTGTDLTVYGGVSWTGGSLLSNAQPGNTVANVNLEGGGTIAPANAGTVTLGSMLNFDADYGPTTVTQFDGTMMVNASSGGMDVKPGAALQETFRTENASISIIPTVDLGTQAITISAGGQISVVGTSKNPSDNSFYAFVPVINSGAFGLSGQVYGVLKGGSANPKVYDYTQTGSASALVIQNGSTLSTSVGLYVNGGTVLLKTNIATGATQVATIAGNLTFEGGTIQFDPPILIGTATVYGQFGITGNVYWGGGTYSPWVNYTPVAGGVSVNSNYWVIGGTLTIPNLNGDFILPAVQKMPANGKPPANTSWDVLQAKTVSNNNGAFLPTVNKDVKGNQLTLQTRVVMGIPVWSLNS